MSEFKIRRGQVFYIPKVKNGQSVHEPYIVLSNNRCNESSNAIHVAPIRVGLASMDKYYQCGFTATCNRDMYVDAAGTTLIDKTQFTEDRYSSAMSFYTVNNKLLLESIEEALCVQLGINKNYVVYGQEESTTKAQEPIQVTINMNITGMDGNTSPVTVTTEPMITATQKKEPDVYIKPEVVRKSVETTQGMSKIAGVSKMYTDDSNGTRRRFTDEMKNKIMETILAKAKAFGGESRSEDIAAELGISVPTVNRYIAKAKEDNKQNKKPKLTKRQIFKPGRKSRSKFQLNPGAKFKDLGPDMLRNLVENYNRHGANYLVYYWPKIFPGKQAVYDFLYRNCKKIK